MPLTTEEFSWYRQLGRGMAGCIVGHEKPGSSPSSPSDEDSSGWRAFDLADAMEQGLACGLTSGYMAPPPEQAKPQSFTVKRSKNRKEYVLEARGGETLLVARLSRDGTRLDFFVPSGGDPPSVVGPTFTLFADSGDLTKWTLVAERCECCEYLPAARACCSGGLHSKRVLARIRHFREEIGEATALCMEVELPTLQPDGTPDIWCPRSTRHGQQERSKLRLESVRPRWSPKLGTLTLNFLGRCKCASAKNFQLQAEGAERSRTEPPSLLFGKTDENTFVLDYQRPLSMAQAFAVALSVKDWH